MCLNSSLRLSPVIIVFMLMLPASGCTVLAVTDAVVSTTVGVTKVAVKGTVAVVDAVVPDGDKKNGKD